MLGRSLEHSFSQAYFSDKFRKLKLDAEYRNFELDDISAIGELLEKHAGLRGLNVTIPFKEAVIPFLDEISVSARSIGAVNTISFEGSKCIGHNTDAPAFAESLTALLSEKRIEKALVLGSGGASKAIQFALASIDMPFDVASTRPEAGQLSYQDLTGDGISQYGLIVHCTPLGTFPEIDEKIDIPYSGLKRDQVLYDLVYNPSLSAFLKEGQKKYCNIKNGQEMLERQAELAWSIWQSKE